MKILEKAEERIGSYVNKKDQIDLDPLEFINSKSESLLKIMESIIKIKNLTSIKLL